MAREFTNLDWIRAELDGQKYKKANKKSNKKKPTLKNKTINTMDEKYGAYNRG